MPLPYTSLFIKISNLLEKKSLLDLPKNVIENLKNSGKYQKTLVDLEKYVLNSLKKSDK